MDDSNPRPWQDVEVQTASSPTGRRKPSAVVARAALATVVAGGLAAGSYGIASATSSKGAAPAPTTAQALTATSTPSASAPWKSRSTRRWAGGPGGLVGPGGLGAFGLLGGGLLGEGGTITAMTPTTITVESLFGRKLTVTTNSSTAYSESGKSVTRTALSVGEQVTFRPAGPPMAPSSKPSSASSEVVTNVEIVQPHVYGKITSVNGSEIVVSEAFGSTIGLNVTVNTSSTGTTYEDAGHTASAADLSVGTVVLVTGTLSSDHDQVDATTVEIVPASVTGQVTAVSGTTITIKSFDGTVETLTTGASTLFRDPGSKAKASIESVAKGDLVEAFGTAGSGNSFAAITVDVGPSLPTAGAPVPGFPGPVTGFGPGLGFPGLGRGFRGRFGSVPPGAPSPVSPTGSATL